MFKKFAAEALGISDVGVIIPPADYDKVDADDYLFHEEGEKIFFLIKSKKDEYCFTNLGLIHVDGESAVSAKRTIKRFDYVSHRISHVSIETAGTIDLDVELKFTIDGGAIFSIDVKKHFLESLKDIYKALITISRLQHKDEIARANAMQCLGAIASMYKINHIDSEEAIVKHYNAILDNLNLTILERHAGRDFSHVFEKYIHA
ncbi:MAG: PH domain-containing protein [Pyrinomonadaceae bacterium MAG19_C2-C3]|nr:PH domain-containing protein [Pyrinomonadaceae bacterium MAG19_C2-C3]